MNSLSEKILILDNLLTKEECSSLIDYYLNSGKIKNINPDEIPLDYSNIFIKNVVDKICFSVNEYLNEDIEFDWGFVSKYSEGGFLKTHKDRASNKTVFTSIVYLNDNFEGGKTFLSKNLEVLPKIGRALSFDGNSYWHGVSMVKSGNRYTLPIWYKLAGS